MNYDDGKRKFVHQRFDDQWKHIEQVKKEKLRKLDSFCSQLSPETRREVTMKTDEKTIVIQLLFCEGNLHALDSEGKIWKRVYARPGYTPFFTWKLVPGPEATGELRDPE